MGKRIWLLLTICMVTVSMAFAQQKVTGTVIESETGEPVVGASVRVKNANAGAATDINGKFTLEVPANSKTLVISYIGMVTKEVAVKSNVKVFLESDTKTLKEQFVVAYGTATKETFTGAASVIDAKVIEDRQVSSIANALAGNIAGVTATSSNGQPGTSATIRVRGFGSINGSMNPLYVLDGMPFDGDISSINPADIESTTVLKDAAACALYGARSANGVILVTTKKGSHNSDAKITFDAKWGVNSRAVKNYDVLTSTDDYMSKVYTSLNNAARYNLGSTNEQANAYANKNIFKAIGLQIYTLPDGQSLFGLDGTINPNATLGYSDGQYYYTPDNWADETFHNGLRQEYNLSVRGGTDKLIYSVSAGYLNDEGVVKNSGFERISSNLNVDYQAKKWLKLGTNVSFVNATSKYPDEQTSTSSSSNAFFIANNIAPIYPMYARYKDGSVRYSNSGKPVYDYGDGTTGNYTRNWMSIANPEGDLTYSNEQYKMDILNTKVYAKVTPIKQLSFTAAYGLHLDNTRYHLASSSLYGQSASYGGSAAQEQIRTSGMTQQYLANFKDTYGDNTVDFLAGYESYQYNYEYVEAVGNYLFKEDDFCVNNAINERRGYGAADEFADRRVFGRLNYDWQERIFGYLSFTEEWSSRFAKGQRAGSFFAASGAWNMAKESFIADLGFVNLLKLRASFGQQGNDNVAGYYGWSNRSVLSGDKSIYALTGSTQGNEKLKWEKTSAFDVAVDFELWDGKLSGSVDFYNRTISDMLYNCPSAPSLSYESRPMNIGSMRNRGVEIELASNLIHTQNIDWNINYNISFNSNKILELYPMLNGKFISGSRIYEEGKSMYQLYLVKYAGVDPSTGLAMYWAKNEETGAEYATTDYTVAQKKNRQGTGNLLPIATGGFSTSLSAYGFDFSVQTSYQFGGKIYDGGYQSLMHGGTNSDFGQNWHKDINKAWTPENTITDVPRLDSQDLYANRTSDRWLVSSNYFSINNVTLGYTLPKSLTRRWDIEGFRVFVSGDNLAVFSARKGLDPRQGFVESTTSTYTALRSISAGFKLTF